MASVRGAQQSAATSGAMPPPPPRSWAAPTLDNLLASILQLALDSERQLGDDGKSDAVCEELKSMLLFNNFIWLDGIDTELVKEMLLNSYKRASDRLGVRIEQSAAIDNAAKAAIDNHRRLTMLYIATILKAEFNLSIYDLHSFMENPALEQRVVALLKHLNFTKEAESGRIGGHPIIRKVIDFLLYNPAQGLPAGNASQIIIKEKLVTIACTLIYLGLLCYARGYFCPINMTYDLYKVVYDVIEPIIVANADAVRGTWSAWDVEIRPQVTNTVISNSPSPPPGLVQALTSQPSIPHTLNYQAPTQLPISQTPATWPSAPGQPSTSQPSAQPQTSQLLLNYRTVEATSSSSSHPGLGTLAIRSHSSDQSGSVPQPRPSSTAAPYPVGGVRPRRVQREFTVPEERLAASMQAGMPSQSLVHPTSYSSHGQYRHSQMPPSNAALHQTTIGRRQLGHGPRYYQGLSATTSIPTYSNSSPPPTSLNAGGPSAAPQQDFSQQLHQQQGRFPVQARSQETTQFSEDMYPPPMQPWTRAPQPSLQTEFGATHSYNPWSHQPPLSSGMQPSYAGDWQTQSGTMPPGPVSGSMPHQDAARANVAGGEMTEEGGQVVEPRPEHYYGPSYIPPRP
ncbi:hypothetical protein CVT26_002355 [Gymnopilus dilepis]|uniref:Uncharacterized protein n=1 Tax=Gymnopilus dilepis TaxID=231916 RepID=A0A409Y3J5_9AGAR|nr:hypothetical protein CVT26_002355 [Gymnopilus dilepis]